jgi:ATP-dependent RNA helicase RhlE
MYKQRRSTGSRNHSPRNHNRSRAKRPLDARLFVQKANPVEEESFTPEHNFVDFGFDDRLLQNIYAKGYTIPTPIQDASIGHIMAGQDVIGIASTGTGKTAAFLLPLIQKVLKNPSHRVLIIAPTRELAVQIYDEFRGFVRGLSLYGAICIGGASLYKQIADLRGNPQFVIGTPGRLNDLEKQHKLRYSSYNSIVLDEVDRMLDMGFIREVRTIISKLPPTRHSLFFSATVAPAIRELMQTFLHEAVTVSIKKQQASENVEQDVVRMMGREKVDVLHDLLLRKGFDKVLLFGRTKWGIEKLSKSLVERGFRVAAIHGNKRQSQRQLALDNFRRNKVQVLLATDIASRGIDVPDVTHVINYDAPESYDDYIHRIGRTGRANKRGIALTFID